MIACRVADKRTRLRMQESRRPSLYLDLQLSDTATASIMASLQDLFDRAALASRGESSGEVIERDASELSLTPLPDADIPAAVAVQGGDTAVGGGSAYSGGAIPVAYIPRHTPSACPPGLSPQELDAALDRLERLAFTLDSKWRIGGPAGVRIGTDSIIGRIPVLGDVITSGYAAYIVLNAARLGLPIDRQKKMWIRVAKDAVLGSVPILGIAVDVWYKANERNVNDILVHFGRPTLGEQRSAREAQMKARQRREQEMARTGVGLAAQPAQIAVQPTQAEDTGMVGGGQRYSTLNAAGSSGTPAGGSSGGPQTAGETVSVLSELLSISNWRSITQDAYRNWKEQVAARQGTHVRTAT